ncbi:TetR/AcrR family transcriptional regulator [Nonomuraea sp. NPDC050556]|uniref:TetR/AcrR family transcriptional regulator n=1 Tax=Nonomuraea sp. NPDC050556 TaxID=3364369 RepID=UPI00379E928E
MGLRELKKRQTRQLIMETAWRLFADRGFDQVTVIEIAREAQVSEATVFNHFPAKEDLFFLPLEAFGARLLEAVGSREGSVAAAFRRFLESSGGLLDQAAAGDAVALERLRTINRVISASPALQAREQQVLGRATEALAEVLGGEVEAWVAAHALMGVHRTMLDFVRRGILAGEEPERLASGVRTLTETAFALLERGLAGYAPGVRIVDRTGFRGRTP